MQEIFAISAEKREKNQIYFVFLLKWSKKATLEY